MKQIVTTGLLCLGVLATGVVLAQEQTYVGAEGPFPACQACHSSETMPEFLQWSMTEHATAYDSALTVVQQSAVCLQCHTTGWDTTVVNLGSDEFVEVAEPFEGRFNVTITDSANFLAKVNVQCEACHGPASNHPPNPSENKPPTRVDAEQCGTCHQDEHHPYIEEWRESKHAKADTNANPFLQNLFRTNPQCAGCHTFQGFLQFVGTTPEDSTNLIPNIENPPGDASLPLVCATCHDPHDAKHEGQLRLEMVDLCVKCHNPEEAEPPENPHHSTASMFDGVGAYEFPDVEYRRQSVHQLMPLIQEEKCVACHVFMTPFDDSDPDNPIPANTGHTFEPRLEGCMQEGCHVNGLEGTSPEKPFDHRGRQTLTESLMDSLENILADIETNLLPTATPEDSFDYEIGLFNLRFAQNEGSRGVHNAYYAEDVLKHTIAFLDTALITAVEPRPDERARVPKSFALHQNYPNPFNPSTTIRFDVPVKSHIKLVIYNALGQVVETLVDHELLPSSYEVVFDASRLSSGLYFYRLVGKDFTSTKKMLLMK